MRRRLHDSSAVPFPLTGYGEAICLFMKWSGVVRARNNKINAFQKRYYLLVNLIAIDHVIYHWKSSLLFKRTQVSVVALFARA
jgi:hypothetical protein